MEIQAGTIGPIFREILGPIFREILGPIFREILGPIFREIFGPIFREIFDSPGISPHKKTPHGQSLGGSLINVLL